MNESGPTVFSSIININARSVGEGRVYVGCIASVTDSKMDVARMGELHNTQNVRIEPSIGSMIYIDFVFKEDNISLHKVVVKYQDTAGNTIKDTVTETVEKGKDYTPDVPSTIPKDGVTYNYVKRNDGKGRTDKIGPVNSNIIVIVIYEVPQEAGKHNVRIEYIYEGKTQSVIGTHTFPNIDKGTKFPKDKSLNNYAYSTEQLKAYFGADKEYIIKNKVSIDGKETALTSLPSNVTVDKDIVIKFYYYVKAEYDIRVFTGIEENGEIKSISCVSDETNEGEIGKSITVPAPLHVGEYKGYRLTTDGTKPSMQPSDIGSLSKGTSVKITLTETSPTACIDFVYITKEEEPAPGDFPEGTTRGGLEGRAEVKLRSNDRGNEEYNVDEAIPTSEDVYANILADGYILEWGEIKRLKSQGTIQLYYKAYYQDWYKVGKWVYNEEKKTSEWVQEYNADGSEKWDWDWEAVYSKTDSATLDYAWYKPTGAALYKIEDNTTVSNGALKNSPVKVPLSSYGATLTFSSSGGFDTSKATKVIDLGYFDSDYHTTSGYSSARNAVNNAYNNNHVSDMEALKNSNLVKMGQITVSGTGCKDLSVIDKSSMSCAESLTYEPKQPTSAPQIDQNVLYKNKDLWIKTDAQNSTYGTTANITYKLAQKGGSIATQPSYSFNLTGNNVKVHTPVVNDTKLDLTDNQKYNQLKNSAENAIVLGRQFTVEIPHNGQHITARGYGNRAYNYKGMTRDVNGTPSNNHFAKSKTIEFEGTGVVYNNTYYPAGTKIQLTVSQTRFNFTIPEWEKEIWNTGTAKIITRVIAENCTNEALEENEANKSANNYVAKKELEIRVVGEMADLRIRGTNDPSWVKIKEVLPTDKMPIGQANQNAVAAYKYALKLGYSAYFDLKVVGSRGDTSTGVNIVPSYYFIPSGGGTAQPADLYYHNSVSERDIKLSNKPVTIEITMTNSKGTDFNSNFTNEMVSANKLYTTKYNYQQKMQLGNTSKIMLEWQTRLPHLEKIQEMKAKYSQAPAEAENAIGHWYGAVRIPASTYATKQGDKNTVLKDGYIAVVFNSVETDSNRTAYLSYANGETKWPASGNKTITLPNGKTASVPSGTAVLYEANIRANNDYEMSGTH